MTEKKAKAGRVANFEGQETTPLHFKVPTPTANALKIHAIETGESVPVILDRIIREAIDAKGRRQNQKAKAVVTP